VLLSSVIRDDADNENMTNDSQPEALVKAFCAIYSISRLDSETKSLYDVSSLLHEVQLLNSDKATREDDCNPQLLYDAIRVLKCLQLSATFALWVAPTNRANDEADNTSEETNEENSQT